MTDRTVSTVEEIDALPDRAVLRDRDGDIWQRRNRRGRTPGDRPWCSYESARESSERLARWAPLTVLVPEQTPPDHLHGWVLVERSPDGWVEGCIDCGTRRPADYR